MTRLGERAARRPEPQLGDSLAGAGIALAVLGILLWGGAFLAGSTSGGGGTGGGSSTHQLLGVGLSLVVVVAGYTLAIARRTGPLATAGVAASALGVPVLLGFMTFNTGTPGSGLPFSLNAMVPVSLLAWLISYLAVPGTRGHAFYLGLAATTGWVYVVYKAEPRLFSVGSLFSLSTTTSSLPGLEHAGPAWSTVAVLSLLFGLCYYAAALLLDRAGRAGIGVALVVSGFLATAAGVLAAAVNLHAIWTGVLLIVVGSVLSGCGAHAGRRFTTWAWAAGVAIGITSIVSDLASNNTAAAGVSLLLAGVVVVLAAHVLGRALHESDDHPTDSRGARAMSPGTLQ